MSPLDATQPDGCSVATPQRIAFCITDLDPGGAERALFEIVTRLDTDRWEPYVFALTSGDVADWLRERNIPVTCFDDTGLPWRSVFSWLTRQFRDLTPVIVQGFLFHGNFVSRIAAWRANVPVCLAGHRVAEREKRWHLWLERITRGLVSHHVCVSRGVADHLVRHCHINRAAISIIPNGIDPASSIDVTPKLRSELGISPDTRVILGVGRLHRQKGFRDLIDAYSGIAEESQDSHLVIVGEGPERDALESRIRALNLSDRVTLMGYRRDVPELIAEADLFVLASLWEGMPNVVLQAMLAGTPVIATDVEGIAELIKDNETGLLTQPGHVGQLRECIKILLHDQDLSIRLAKRSQDIVKKEFTWNKVSLGYSHLFHTLADR